MEDKVRKALEAWNEFMQGYLLAKSGWEKFSDQVREERIDLEEFPIEAQRAISRCNPKAKFTVALPRFADHIRGYMNADELIFPIPEKEEEKPKPKNKRTLKGE